MCVQVCDLLPGCVLGVMAFVQVESGPEEFLGGAVMGLFSKKGRLKTSLQRLKLCLGEWPDLRWNTKTPGKVPIAERGCMGGIEQKLKQFERLDMPRCSWLDGKTLAAIKALQASHVMVCLRLCCIMLFDVLDLKCTRSKFERRAFKNSWQELGGPTS
jgi:hypothetical protein